LTPRSAVFHSRRVPAPVPRAPVVVDPVFDDPAMIRALLERHAPYWPVQRYFASAEEQRALSASARAPVIGPVFRGDWAYDRPLVEGVEPILRSPRFVAAARTVFGASIVRPQIVYVNLSLPMPCGDGGHTDVPAFRGIDRTVYPVWLLVTMGRSGLFERWRIHIATAVAWFYAGRGGEFTYWPDGPDRQPVVRPMRSNTAVVGDNDVMFHRVESIGGPEDDMVRGLTLDSELCPGPDGEWEVADHGRVLGRYPFAAVRVSVSWKGQVFRDAEEARLADEHRDDLGFETVLETFLGDLAARGLAVAPPDDPLHDPAFVATLTAAYRQSPSVYPWGQAN
jgi:hypothetical protein